MAVHMAVLNGRACVLLVRSPSVSVGRNTNSCANPFVFPLAGFVEAGNNQQRSRNASAASITHRRPATRSFQSLHENTQETGF